MTKSPDSLFQFEPNNDNCDYCTGLLVHSTTMQVNWPKVQGTIWKGKHPLQLTLFVIWVWLLLLRMSSYVIIFKVYNSTFSPRLSLIKPYRPRQHSLGGFYYSLRTLTQKIRFSVPSYHPRRRKYIRKSWDLTWVLLLNFVNCSFRIPWTMLQFTQNLIIL